MRQRIDVQVHQDTIQNARKNREHVETAPFVAQVVAVYSDRMTCDLKTVDGQFLLNVSILTNGGLVDGKPYGEVDLPAIDDYIFVMYASFGARHKVILGTVFPYLTNEFNADAVNSSNKTFTKKLLEKDMPLGYRRIFKSGASVQVEEDGRIIVETPDGTHVLFGGDDEILEVLDKHGNKMLFDSSGVVIDDTNGNNITMASGKVTINGNLEVDQ